MLHLTPAAGNNLPLRRFLLWYSSWSLEISCYWLSQQLLTTHPFLSQGGRVNTSTA